MIALHSPPASPASVSSRQHLGIDAPAFKAGFNQTPFLVQHSLCEHPLFNLERLLDLAKTLPEECIEYNAGKLPVSISHAETPRNGLSPAETIRRISECKSWLVLKYVERDPAYKALLDECLAQVAEHSEELHPGMCAGQAFVFITSPGSVTPLHIDPE
ncbi:MAG TPA: transcription factor, partial [Caulifigura sp.]|nr:transcription factor [Caulifigura sp.]